MRQKIAALSLSASALVAIATYEGFRSEAYTDVVGVPTIGFGTTAGVKAGDKIEPVRALALLLADASKTEQALAKCFGSEVTLTQSEWDAFVSLAYNVGSGAVCRSSIVRKVKAGQYDAACRTILDFNKVSYWVTETDTKTGKKTRVKKYRVVKGLDVRRKKEYATCVSS